MNIKKILKPVLSIVLALVLGAVVIALVGENPLSVYKSMLLGAFGSKNATAGTFVKTTTMIFVSLSYGFAYKCRLINIGIEGQLYMGGLFSAIASIYLKLPMALHILVCLAAGFIGGAFWGGIVGWLKNRFKASEMITTVMMNYIAIYIVQYMVNGPIKEEKGTYPQSENILESAQLPLLVPKTQLTIGILLVILLTVFLYKTQYGVQVRGAGEYPLAIDSAGMSVNKIRYISVIAGSMIIGLGGAYLSLGELSFFTEDMVTGRGYIALAAVIFGRYTPVGTWLAVLVFGAGEVMVYRLQAASVGIPTQLILMIPYLLTVIVVAVFGQKGSGPAALGIPFSKNQKQ